VAAGSVVSYGAAPTTRRIFAPASFVAVVLAAASKINNVANVIVADIRWRIGIGQAGRAANGVVYD